MYLDFLDFEQPIAAIEAKIKDIRSHGPTNKKSQEEIKRLEEESCQLTKTIFSSLTPFNIVKLARHPQRPHTLDYIKNIFTDFDELCGDRHFACGKAIVGGLARFDGLPVVVIGHQKGRSTKENIERNFAYAHPEEYRKSLRLMKMAERFSLPIFTFIDTPGAFPGIGAEERNQSEAIARNLLVMSHLATPIICTIIGEGGSGGALALGIGDKVLMLQYSIYTTITPEGCASILWRNPAKAPEAAAALKLTSNELYNLGLIDEVVPEPLGGAHRNHDEIQRSLKRSLQKTLHELMGLTIQELVSARNKKILNYGR